ncbi:MAG: Gfo/Idh/MocA family oxidoreductase [Planctomycetaceae bacterium]|jgi:predicted dehydrogenase|nr:Gfo/Idh/MocA family oxidoreductase [Planctomycetaceae bacterium]
MKTYRIGLIGFGMIGKVHAFGYAALPYYSEPFDVKFQLSHVATAHPETAEKAKRICGAEIATTDFRHITENPDIDIVHICTPNNQHFEPLANAIRNAKHIYCDKPLTASLAEAEQLLKIIDTERYSATNQMTFHLRFFSAIQKAKRLIDEGQLGRIYQFRLAYLHSSNASPLVPFKWKHSEFGGVVRDLVSHLFDLTDYLVGALDSLLAETQHAIRKRPVSKSNSDWADVPAEDAVTILVKTCNEAHGILEATKLATGNEDEMRFEINGEKGSIRFSLMNPHFLEFFDAVVSDKPLGGYSGWRQIPCGGRLERPETDFPSPKSTTGWVRAHISCLSNFLHAVTENRPASPDLLQGIKIDRWIDAVFRSAQTRTWINLK